MMMKIPIPDTEEIKQHLAGIDDLTHIATGGFKVVFKGIDSSQQVEAIKAIYIPTESDGFEPEQIAQLLARAQREIAALRLCKSPCIVRLGTLEPKLVKVSAGDYLVYSEEFLSGGPLSAQIGRLIPQPNLPILADVFMFLIEVIEEMVLIEHLHRDIKPANIMVTGDEKRPYVILDMGIAYKMHGTKLTQGPTPPGTLRYMAPELLLPDYRDVMDFRCDLYSAALSVYELASGVQPFAPRPENDYATLYRILNDKPVVLETLRPDLPPKFCRVVDRCIKKSPALRYARMDLLRHDLQEAQQ
jgi:serine/threonine-protein kinase